MKKFKISAIICAAGSGTRAGFDRNKLLVPLYGAPALYHTLKKFNIEEIDEVIVTSSNFDFEEISALCAPFGFKTVIGGSTRTQSVKNALKTVTGDIVLIHDGARPYVEKQLILNCIDAVKKFGSGVCAVKFTDTAVYSVFGEITAHMDRDSLFGVQTPQGFLTEDICRAYELSGEEEFTDDSAVYGKYIAPARVICGDERNIKLTYAEDFMRELPTVLPVTGRYMGIGADTHPFKEGGGIVLGGVKIPLDKSLAAHSDGDVVYHAITDALLSAAGLKDIGHYFPDSDEKLRGADSGNILKQAVKIILGKGYVPINVSVTVQAEAPKLAPYIDEMVKNISGICGVAEENCTVAAGTCEGLGFVGEGLGITAYCIAALNTKDA